MSKYDKQIAGIIAYYLDKSLEHDVCLWCMKKKKLDKFCLCPKCQRKLTKRVSVAIKNRGKKK